MNLTSCMRHVTNKTTIIHKSNIDTSYVNQKFSEYHIHEFDRSYQIYDKDYKFPKLNKYLKSLSNDSIRVARIVDFVIGYLKDDGIPSNLYIYNDIKKCMEIDIRTLIREKKGVCMHFTKLVEYISKNNNIKNVMIIRGFCKSLDPTDKYTVIEKHAWLIYNNTIIDPSFMYSKRSEGDISVGYWYDIDPTIASYIYYPASESGIGDFGDKYDNKSVVGSWEIRRDKFFEKIKMDSTQQTLTHKRMSFKWFTSTPYITHEYKYTNYKLDDVEAYKTVIKKHSKISSIKYNY